MYANILKIQRMSTDDGPGIRTTVFFKGCPLKCKWCHNPESISAHSQLVWNKVKCIGCKICLAACPLKNITFGADGLSFDRKKCLSCSAICAEECPSTALEILGKRWKLFDLLNEVLKDRLYFAKSGGGVTLSGGEPMMQASFVGQFFKELKREKIHTALDTSGQFEKQSLEMVWPYVDLILFDLKEIDPVKHQLFTGHSNLKILENLIYLGKQLREERKGAKKLWIRTPIIPGKTAFEQNIKKIGNFCASHLPGLVDRFELCAFNNLCKDKYQQWGIDWEFKDATLIDQNEMEYFCKVARSSGVNHKIVRWSGLTKE